MIDAVSRLIVGLVRACHRRRTWVSGLALGLILVVATAYLLVGALQINPSLSTYRVTIHLPESGGLLPNQDVTVRGVSVGRIESLRPTPAGVDVVANVTSNVRIPASSQVRVSGLSAAGEQFIDFRTDSENGPYLTDGSVIDQQRTTTPVQLSELLAHADGLLAQIDPKKLAIIKREMSVSDEGPGKLRDIVDGGTFLLATLDSVLPETVSLLRSSRTALTLLTDVNPGIGATAQNVRQVMAGLNEMDGGYRRFLDQTPGLLSSMDRVFDDNSDTMVGLLANLVTTSRLLYLRVPALNALFPNYRGSMLEAIGSIMHDDGLWAIADIYPRYSCDYGTPRRDPRAADYPEPFLYTYCRDDDPAVLIRGAKNAPRPAGDDTAGPPPGADLGKTTDPTPKGRYTIPTPYGGPTLPIEPPR